MATRTQVQIEFQSGCIHELIYQTAYEQHRRRIGGLCRWMAPDAGQADALTESIFVEAWWGHAGWHERPGDLDLDEDRLIETLARRLWNLFAGASANLHPHGSARAPADLRSAVAALPPHQRLLYLLHELVGYPPATLGAWLDLEPSWCAQMIHQARLQLCCSLVAD